MEMENEQPKKVVKKTIKRTPIKVKVKATKEVNTEETVTEIAKKRSIKPKVKEEVNKDLNETKVVEVKQDIQPEVKQEAKKIAKVKTIAKDKISKNTKEQGDKVEEVKKDTIVKTKNLQSSGEIKEDATVEEKTNLSENKQESADTNQENVQKNNKFNKFNKNQKNKNNNNKKKNYEAVQEVNLDENPDVKIIKLSDLTVLDFERLRTYAAEMEINAELILDLRKNELIREIIKMHLVQGGAICVTGTVEIMSEGHAFIRYAKNSYTSSSEDVYIASGMVKACGLKTGHEVYGQVRTPRDTDRCYFMYKIFTVGDESVQEAKVRPPFESLTPLFPDEKLNLEYKDNKGKKEISTRVVDLFCPIGKGQRSLIVAPPRTGKTILMQKIANAISLNHPEVKLMVLLVDERPEEVTDMRRNVNAEVFASTFDEQASRHVQVAEIVIEKAKRLVEKKTDVVILLDSITRLARAYNQTSPASGKVLSGGVDSNALHKPKRFFGAARNIENGGSLTIISTALIETGSRMDEVIFEEFKGTGNNEIVLDRRMADTRKFPAINLRKSGTRRDDLLLSSDEISRLWLIRNAVDQMDDGEMSFFLIDKMQKSEDNKTFLASLSGPSVNGVKILK